MNLIDEKGSIRYLNFLCLDTNQEYNILATSSTYKGYGKDDRTMSTSKVSKGELIRWMTQPQLRERFINIKQL
jgi:hypothetical protein